MEENVTILTVLQELRDFRAENNKRWEQNDKRWEENDKRWEQNEKTREKEHQELLDILLQFDITISIKLGDPNVEKMKKVLGM